MIKNNTIYFENLDGLRAISAFSVILFHISIWVKYETSYFNKWISFFISFGWKGGDLGVMFFFILSGFLITYLLFIEIENNKSINIFKFYIRRILRIWPLYYITLFIGFILFPSLLMFLNVDFKETANIYLYILFLTNIDHIYYVLPKSGILGVQWSVSIEEQFYLIWPILLSVFKSKISFIILCILLFIFSEYYSIENHDNGLLHFSIFNNIRFLIFGAILAFFSFYFKNFLFFQQISKKVIIIIYLIFLIIIYNFRNLEYFFHFSVLELLIIFFFGFVILEQNYSNNSFFKMKKFTVISYFGKLSYGLYLMHMVVIYLVNYFIISNKYFIFKIFLILILSIILSYISYITIEKYFLNKKNKYIIN
jgi:peptidoglycan/LPS O-acetylase OafA/YrhL